MKKIVTISLFIFWAVVTALMAAGLIFYQKNNVACAPCLLGGVTGTGSSTVSGVQGSVTLDMNEIAKHNMINDCWLLISGKVYNVTSYISGHPGGVAAIAPTCGKDATIDYQTKDIGRPHSSNAYSLLNNYYIGDFNQTIGAQQIQQDVQKTNAIPTPAGGGDYEND